MTKRYMLILIASVLLNFSILTAHFAVKIPSVRRR